jgi:hypothetical protein
MNATESQEFVSDDTEQSIDKMPYGSDNLKLVPVAESIRYRKRAQSAEKKAEMLNEQLTEAKSQAAKMSEQLNDIRLEQKLMRRLNAAGAVDLEAAVLIAKAKLEGDNDADLDGLIKQLKKEKQYLFAEIDTTALRTMGDAMAAKKTAGARDRMQNSQAVLERAAQKAATTGNRTDLQEYLKLRRNYL